MASNPLIPIRPPSNGLAGKWLFYSQNLMLGVFRQQIKMNVPGLSLKVQIFVFHEGRLLLLQPEGKEIEDKWTAPSKIVLEDPAPQTNYRVVIRMLKHVIEERMLPSLQFADLFSADHYVLESWSAEKAEGSLNTKEIPLSIILTVGGSKLDDRSVINYPAKYSSMKWFTFEQASKLKLDELPVARLTRIYAQLAWYASVRHSLITNSHFSDLKDISIKAAHIQLELRTVDRGAVIPYALMLILKNEAASPLFIVDIPKKINDRIHKDYIHQKVFTRIPLAGRMTQTTQYRIVGRLASTSATHIHDNVGMPSLAGVWSESTRMKIEFMGWENRIMSLEG